MTITWAVGRLRWCLALAIALLTGGLGYYLFGLEGCLFAGLFSRRLLVALWREPSRTASLHELHIIQLWMLQSMVLVVAEENRFWILRDELSPSEWSAIRRYLRSQCPAEPIGLSISR